MPIMNTHIKNNCHVASTAFIMSYAKSLMSCEIHINPHGFCKWGTWVLIQAMFDIHVANEW